MALDLRTFCYIDILQPQVASFQATVSQGYLPVEEQAALIVEVAPGIEINRITDVALKQTSVHPGMLIVERAFGMVELHSFSHGEVRAAGEAILDALQMTEQDRLAPRVVSDQIITGVDPHHTMLVNRMRHGQLILKGQSLYMMEVQPAGYALLAANEAEKAAPIEVLEVVAFGAFGRVYLGGKEEPIREAQKAAKTAVSALGGRALQTSR